MLTRIWANPLYFVKDRHLKRLSAEWIHWFLWLFALLCFEHIEKGLIAQNKKERGEGKKPCAVLLHWPFCSSILHDTWGNKSKLCRQATVGRGLALLSPPSLTSDAGSTNQSDIWQYRKNRHKAVLVMRLAGIWLTRRYLWFFERKQKKASESELLRESAM